MVRPVHTCQGKRFPLLPVFNVLNKSHVTIAKEYLVKLALGLILMVLGVMGIVKGNADSTASADILSRATEENNRNVPLEPLASSGLLVGGVLIRQKPSR